MPTGQQQVTLVPKDFTDLTVDNVSGFTAVTWSSRTTDDVNPTFAQASALAEAAEELVKAAEPHYCSNTYVGRVYYKDVARGNVSQAAYRRWPTCGRISTTRVNLGNRGISEIVYRDPNGKAVYLTRAAITGAASYATAGYVRNRTDVRFNKTPDAVAGTFAIQNVTFTSSTSVQTRSTTIAAATGGTGVITYRLISPPSGVTLNGRVLSFAPAARGTLSVTVRATWTSGTSTAHLDRTAVYTVPRSSAARAGRFVLAAKSVNRGATTQTVTIEAASGGTGTISYTLRTAPAGISLSGRTLSVPSSIVSGAHTIVVRATWTTTEHTWTLGGRTAAVDATINVVNQARTAAGYGWFL